MADVTTTAPMDEVRGLVEERGRYEGWLAALEARRAVTPAHVLDRVRQDYDARLGRVLDALDGHSGALRSDEAALAAHHDQQLRTLSERRDLLAEVELRTLVGEYAPEEGERQRREVEGAIGELEGGLAASASQLADVRGLLGRVARDPQPAPAPTDGRGEAAPAPASQQVTSAFTPAAGVASVTDDRLGLDAARAALGDADPRGYSAMPTPGAFAAGSRPAAPRATPPLAGQSFADAAFRATPGQGDAAVATSNAAGLAATPPGGGGAVAQEKTLRCPDCGAVNYPTEWYCEKCSGELAAL